MTKRTEFLPDFKICNECKQKKPQIEFYLSKRRADGLCDYCIDCRRHIRRKEHLLLKFDMTEKQYKQTLKSQNNTCAICGQPETMRDRSGKIQVLSVDHDHKTKKVRALLCSRCNSSIGKFNHNPELLEAAAKYLRFHST